MKSKVHPTYKTKYRVANWAAYNQRPRSTRRCDGVVILGSDRCLDAPPERPAGWAAALLGSRHRDRPDPAAPLPSPATPGRRVPARAVRDDAPRPLRSRLYDALPAQSASEAPSATGPARREHPSRARQHGSVHRRGRASGPQRNTVARGRRGWRKLHLGVDQSGVIRVHTLTEETGDDAITALDLLTAVEGPLVRITADAAYDTVAVYDTAGARGAPMTRSPSTKRRGRGGRQSSSPRPGRRILNRMTALGRRIWARPAVARAGSDDHVGEDTRPAPVAEGVRVPSSDPGGEHVLPLQVHHRRWPSRPESSWAGE